MVCERQALKNLSKPEQQVELNVQLKRLSFLDTAKKELVGLKIHVRQRTIKFTTKRHLAFGICSNKNCNKEHNETNSIICPICKQGHLQKKTAIKGKNKGKDFWACDRFPKCKTTFSEEPVNEVCGICGSQMVKKGDNVSCTKSTCENYIK